MRAFWAAHHRKAQWGEFREMFNSRAEIMPFVIPSALIKDATSLQKYIQIAANDNILVYTEADSVVAHAKTNAKAVDTLVHLSLHPDWWTGASLAYQPPEPAQPSKQNYHPFPASKAEHKICFNCQEKGHIIRDCPTLFEEPEPMYEDEGTDYHQEEDYIAEDDDEYDSLYDDYDDDCYDDDYYDDYYY